MATTTKKPHMENEPLSKPWWKEPWPWFLMAGPALAMVGCIITIVLAVNGFRNEAITEGGVKRGLVVEKHEAPQKHSTGDKQP